MSDANESLVIVSTKKDRESKTYRSPIKGFEIEEPQIINSAKKERRSPKAHVSAAEFL